MPLVHDSALSLPNLLINGNFDYTQRATSFTGTSGYTLDRWYLTNGAGTGSVSRETTLAPSGSTYYMRILAGAAGFHRDIAQPLEDKDVNKVKGKYVTFSVLLRKTIAWNTVVNLTIQKNAVANINGGSWTTIQSLAVPSTSIVAASWTRFSVTTLVPDDGTANGLRVGISIGSLSSAGSQVLEISQAMLVEGTALTPFRTAGGSTASELVLCQRFYEKSYSIDTAPGTTLSNADVWDATAFWDGTRMYGMVKEFKVEKRITPTVVTYADGASGQAYFRVPGTTQAVAVGTVALSGRFSIVSNSGTLSVAFPQASGDSIGIGFGWTADSEL